MNAASSLPEWVSFSMTGIPSDGVHYAINALGRSHILPKSDGTEVFFRIQSSKHLLKIREVMQATPFKEKQSEKITAVEPGLPIPLVPPTEA